MHRQATKKKHKILQMWKLRPRVTYCNYNQAEVGKAQLL